MGLEEILREIVQERSVVLDPFFNQVVLTALKIDDQGFIGTRTKNQADCFASA